MKEKQDRKESKGKKNKQVPITILSSIFPRKFDGKKNKTDQVENSPNELKITATNSTKEINK